MAGLYVNPVIIFQRIMMLKRLEDMKQEIKDLARVQEVLPSHAFISIIKSFEDLIEKLKIKAHFLQVKVDSKEACNRMSRIEYFSKDL